MPDTAGHNSSARAATIKNVCERLQGLFDQRKMLNEDISSLKNEKIKGELGMKITDFMMAFRLYQLEGDDRDKLLDTLKETFEALGIGEQLDFIDAFKKAAE
jgi:hypothetical protein